MHLKALLISGAAIASLVAGSAGTVLIGHASSVPAKHHTTVHHVSNTNHKSGTKGNTGVHKHHHKNTGTVKHHHHAGAGKGNSNNNPNNNPPQPQP